MNIQEYISSGVLEAYVFGELPDSEMREIEKIAEAYQEVKQEIARIEQSMEQLAFAAAVRPSPKVKDNLFSLLEDEPIAKPEALKKEAYRDAVQRMPGRANPIASTWKYAVAASILFAITASVLAIYYRSQCQSTQQQLNIALAETQRVAQDYNMVNEKLDVLENDYNIINNSAYQKVMLKGTENSPTSQASIYWNPTTSEVYLSVHSMEKLSDDKQFQLWAIVDGKPVDAGIFDLTNNHLLKMSSISKASAFAVTIEPKGGSQSPTLETMQVMGKTGEV